MSVVETSNVRVTKTVVRFSPKDYEDLMVRAALTEAGINPKHADLATHVRVEGEDLIVELMVESGVDERK